MDRDVALGVVRERADAGVARREAVVVGDAGVAAGGRDGAGRRDRAVDVDGGDVVQAGEDEVRPGARREQPRGGVHLVVPGVVPQGVEDAAVRVVGEAGVVALVAAQDAGELVAVVGAGVDVVGPKQDLDGVVAVEEVGRGQAARPREGAVAADQGRPVAREVERPGRGVVRVVRRVA